MIPYTGRGYLTGPLKCGLSPMSQELDKPSGFPNSQQHISGLPRKRGGPLCFEIQFGSFPDLSGRRTRTATRGAEMTQFIRAARACTTLQSPCAPIYSAQASFAAAARYNSRGVDKLHAAVAGHSVLGSGSRAPSGVLNDC
jgi:hypothetical protein